jgi:hypothetical protein
VNSYCKDVFDWRPSLLGNRKLNTPMHTRHTSTVGSDTLTTPVLLVTITTNIRNASVGRIATKSRKVSLGCLATNSRKASVGRISTNSRKASVGCLATHSRYHSIGPSECYIVDNNREHESVSGIRVSQSVSRSRGVQCSQWEAGALEEFQ